MNLVKDKWTYNDGIEFVKYLESLKREDKIKWARNIINTGMPLLALKTSTIRDIVKEISKGDFISFLDLELTNYFENISVNGSLITLIKDFDLMKKYLDKYVLTIDNWASCDLLSFNMKNNEDKYFDITLEYIKSDLPFVKRTGLGILLKLVGNDKYIDRIFGIMNRFYNEEEYYVNMMNAWLFCECFIKQRDKTIEYLKTHKLNKFTINKGISKCRDSFRVSIEDKEMLIGYRK